MGGRDRSNDSVGPSVTLGKSRSREKRAAYAEARTRDGGLERSGDGVDYLRPPASK